MHIIKGFNTVDNYTEIIKFAAVNRCNIVCPNEIVRLELVSLAQKMGAAIPHIYIFSDIGHDKHNGDKLRQYVIVNQKAFLNYVMDGSVLAVTE